MLTAHQRSLPAHLPGGRVGGSWLLYMPDRTQTWPQGPTNRGACGIDTPQTPQTDKHTLVTEFVQ